MTSHRSSSNRLATEERRHSVMLDYVEKGITNIDDLAKRHGCSRTAIENALQYVLEQLRTTNLAETRIQQNLALKRLEHTFQLATDGYMRSREDEVEVRTEYKKERCPDCRGTGFKSGNKGEGPWCEACEGKGKIDVETVTRRVKGKAGDPTFLRIRNDSVRSIAKLQGIYEDERRQPAVAPQVFIQQNTIDLSRIPSDVILEAKRGWLALQDAQKEAQPDIVVESEGKNEAE